jgi:ApbE superfamily uncharacterized protein (UPF0280 family)
MNHGPIDLIVQAWGEVDEVQAAYEQAANRFQTILGELVEELPALRRAANVVPRVFAGATARRMEAATSRFAETFVTPMAAVAGSVSDEVLAAMMQGRTLARAYVNDGGDIALHLTPGNSLRLAVAGTGNGFADQIEVTHQHPVRGVATSGWRGRSHSLGIADAVTVLATDAATADTAATLIANAVDLPGHPSIVRAPANSLQPESDLGERLVTTGVGKLTAAEASQALAKGVVCAEAYQGRGLIEAFAIFLGDEMAVSRPPNQPRTPRTNKFSESQNIPLSYMAMANAAGCRNLSTTVS